LLQASSIVDAEVGVAVSIDGPLVGATPAWSVVVGHRWRIRRRCLRLRMCALVGPGSSAPARRLAVFAK
jgi:hypothetical protein